MSFFLKNNGGVVPSINRIIHHPIGIPLQLSIIIFSAMESNRII
jgi:hypothetical protein